MDQEAPKNKQDTSQVPRHSAKVGQSNSTSRPTTIIPATKNATLPNTGEKSNILAWLGGILAAILVGILALKAKNSKK